LIDQEILDELEEIGRAFEIDIALEDMKFRLEVEE
jgi:hypothetical protein